MVAEAMSVAADVREFHEVFGCEIAGRLGLPPDDVRECRLDLLTEEYSELFDAEHYDDLVEIADALADMTYILYGHALAYGINLDAVLDEVHRSNMSKLGADGKPIYREDGKVLKGPNYTPPNIRKALGL